MEAEQILLPTNPWLRRIAGLLSDHVFLLLVIAYALGAVFPSLGIFAQTQSIGRFPGTTEPLKLSTVFLGALLFTAGLGIERVQIVAFVRKPLSVVAGVLAKIVCPLFFAFLIAHIGSFLWPDSAHWMALVTGIFLIASLPVATATMGWSHHAHGNLALSISLLGISTLLSPLMTPFGLTVANWAIARSDTLRLMEFSHRFASTFMISAVLAPAIAGLIVSKALGKARIDRAQPVLKLVSLGCLLVLNYMNASASLPELLRAPDPQLLFQAFVGVFLLATANFSVGALLARCTTSNPGERLSILFALGMCNNGAGLVFATLTLTAPNAPIILLPLLLYNLIQHLLAGIADRLSRRSPPSIDQSTTS